MLASFILLAISEKNWPERRFKQWYSGFPLHRSFGNSLVLLRIMRLLKNERNIYLKKISCHVCVNLVLQVFFCFVFVLPAASGGKASWSKKKSYFNSTKPLHFPVSCQLYHCLKCTGLHSVLCFVLELGVDWFLPVGPHSELTDCSPPQKQALRTNWRSCIKTVFAWMQKL